MEQHILSYRAEKKSKEAAIPDSDCHQLRIVDRDNIPKGVTAASGKDHRGENQVFLTFFLLFKALDFKRQVPAELRTFALIVSAHPYCARNSHATSCIERAR